MRKLSWVSGDKIEQINFTHDYSFSEVDLIICARSLPAL